MVLVVGVIIQRVSALALAAGLSWCLEARAVKLPHNLPAFHSQAAVEARDMQLRKVDSSSVVPSCRTAVGFTNCIGCEVFSEKCKRPWISKVITRAIAGGWFLSRPIPAVTTAHLWAKSEGLRLAYLKVSRPGRLGQHSYVIGHSSGCLSGAKLIALKHASGFSATLRRTQLWRPVHKQQAWTLSGYTCSPATHAGVASLVATALQRGEELLELTGASLTPGYGDVHIWWLQSAEVRSPKLLDQYKQLLPKAEREFVEQGASAEVKKERLLARILVRTVLARYCSGAIGPQSLSFESSPNGKPWLVSAEAWDAEGGWLHFNLTHTQDLLGVAVARGRFVGLDVESSGRLTRSDPIRLARRRFSPQEVSALEGTKDMSERATMFMRLWTLKEAYVKATGRGISAAPGLKAFTMQLLPQSDAAQPASLKSGGAQSRDTGKGLWSGHLPYAIQFRAPDGEERNWEVLLMEVWGGHTAALCVESENQSRHDSEASTEKRRPCQLRMFSTVPLLHEAEISSSPCIVLGYGSSA